MSDVTTTPKTLDSLPPTHQTPLSALTTALSLLVAVEDWIPGVTTTSELVAVPPTLPPGISGLFAD
jgi:hypothetical protein